jgi:hypothetical protein
MGVRGERVESTIRRLKVVAKEQCIPYQALMRISIAYGLEARKKPRDLPENQLCEHYC